MERRRGNWGGEGTWKYDGWVLGALGVKLLKWQQPKNMIMGALIGTPIYGLYFNYRQNAVQYIQCYVVMRRKEY